MRDCRRPPSWPVVPAGGPNLWPILDIRAMLASTGGPELPDASWVPLMAAVLSFADLERKQRTQLLADLGRHAPGVSAATTWKKVTPAKGCALAEAAGLDVEAFCLAMLLVTRSQGLLETLKRLGDDMTFSAACDWRLVELRKVGKALPGGLSRLAALDTLALLNASGLRSAAHLEELAALPQRVFLNLAFDGKPDLPGPHFRCPDLALFAPGGFRGLAFETTGSPVEVSVAQLATLANWPHLTHLSLRRTTLGRPNLAALAEVHRAVHGARTLVVEVAPQGDWRAAAPGVELRVGVDAALAS